MANTYSTLSSLFTAIANAIRSKDGTSATIKADNFPARINAIRTSAPDGKEWTANATLPPDITGLAYGAGKFWAIRAGSTNAAYYSFDGITWTAKSLPVDATWQDVAYSDGYFVAISQEGKVAFCGSKTITWQAGGDLPTASGGFWTSVAGGRGKFIAVASTSSGGLSAISTGRGASWRSLPNLATNYPRKIVYGENRFFVLHQTGEINKRFADDADETSAWLLDATLTTGTWSALCYGAGYFVALCSQSNKMAYWSGSTWTESTLPASRNWAAVTYGNGKFIAAALNSAYGAYALRATPGTWTQMTMPSVTGYNHLAWGNGIFVAIGAQVAAYSYTTNDH